MSGSRKRQMHSRNIFRTPPDYTALAIKHKDFRKVCKLELNGKVRVDYKNEVALRALTQMLLEEFFELHVDFAPGSLVPTLPLRLNYILWLEDLLVERKSCDIKGIDIGCGSSCIYSLLAAKKNGWHMTALESNATNVSYASENVERNHLQHLVKVFKQIQQEHILKDYFESLRQDDDNETFDFCLCNPPFYDSSTPESSATNTRNPSKRAPPHNCRTGLTDELSCFGGEVQFVKTIIEESLLYPEQICIYTSMLGHKSSLNRIMDILKSYNINNFCSTEFHQGNTTRWGVAWSFAKDKDLTKT